MAGTINQVLETKYDDSRGTVTVIVTSDSGSQYSATREYNNHFFSDTREIMLQKATQEALDKC